MSHSIVGHPRCGALPQPRWAAIMSALATSAVFVFLLLSAPTAGAQEQQAPEKQRAPEPAEPESDELDVTLQIIVDPDAKLPDEVVRRIPLPVRKSSAEPSSPDGAGERSTPEAAKKGQQRASEAQEQGREVADRARERAQEAAEQREQAGRSAAEERRRNPPGPPPEPPGRPPR